MNTPTLHIRVRSVRFNVCYVASRFVINDTFPLKVVHCSSTVFEGMLAPVWCVCVALSIWV